MTELLLSGRPVQHAQSFPPVEVAHVACFDDVMLGVPGFPHLLLSQQHLILLQLLLVRCCHKLVLVTKQMVLSLPLLQ